MKLRILLCSLLFVPAGASTSNQQLLDALELASTLSAFTLPTQPKDALKKLLSLNQNGAIHFNPAQYPLIKQLLQKMPADQKIGLKGHGQLKEFSIKDIGIEITKTKGQQDFAQEEETTRATLEQEADQLLQKLQQQAQQELLSLQEQLKRAQLTKDINKEESDLRKKIESDFKSAKETIIKQAKDRTKTDQDFIKEHAKKAKELEREYAQDLEKIKTQFQEQSYFPNLIILVQAMLTSLNNDILDYKQNDTTFINFKQTDNQFKNIVGLLTKLQEQITALHPIVKNINNNINAQIQTSLGTLQQNLESQQAQLKQLEQKEIQSMDEKDQQKEDLKKLSLQIKSLKQDILQDTADKEKDRLQKITDVYQHAAHQEFITTMTQLYPLLFHQFMLEPVLIGKDKPFLQINQTLKEFNLLTFEQNHKAPEVLKTIPKNCLTYITTALSMIWLEYQYLFPLNNKISLSLSVDAAKTIGLPPLKWGFYAAHAGFDKYENNKLFSEKFNKTVQQKLMITQDCINQASDLLKAYDLSDKDKTTQDTTKQQVLDLINQANGQLFTKAINTGKENYFFKLQNEFRDMHPVHTDKLDQTLEPLTASLAIVWLEMVAKNILKSDEKVKIEFPKLDGNASEFVPADWATYSAHAGYDNAVSANKTFVERVTALQAKQSQQSTGWFSWTAWTSFFTTQASKLKESIKGKPVPLDISDL